MVPRSAWEARISPDGLSGRAAHAPLVCHPKRAASAMQGLHRVHRCLLYDTLEKEAAKQQTAVRPALHRPGAVRRGTRHVQYAVQSVRRESKTRK